MFSIYLDLKLDLNQRGSKEATLDSNDECCLGSDGGTQLGSRSLGSGSCSSSQDTSDHPRWMTMGWMGLLGFLFSFEKKLSSLNWKTFHIKKKKFLQLLFSGIIFDSQVLPMLAGLPGGVQQLEPAGSDCAAQCVSKKPNWFKFDGRTHCNVHFRDGGGKAIMEYTVLKRWVWGLFCSHRAYLLYRFSPALSLGRSYVLEGCFLLPGFACVLSEVARKVTWLFKQLSPHLEWEQQVHSMKK